MSMENAITRFHFGHERGVGRDPQYSGGYGTDYPPLQSFGNLSYLQLIDLITWLWSRAHPEVKIVPYGNRAAYDPEMGTIVYNLDQKVPKDDNAKARFKKDIAITDHGNVDVRVLTQSFNHLVEFTAIHRDPRTAEEILEAFEDFIMVIGPEIKSNGAEEFMYNRRVSDRDMTRFGEDVAARSVMYLAILQKVFMVRPETLEQIQIEVRILREQATPESNEVLFTRLPLRLSIRTYYLDPQPQVGEAFSQQLIVESGPDYVNPRWSVQSGSLPSGLSLSIDGLLSGTPDTAGPYDFEVLVVDGDGVDTERFVGEVLPAG